METSSGAAILRSTLALHLIWAIFIIQGLYLSFCKMGLAHKGLKMVK